MSTTFWISVAIGLGIGIGSVVAALCFVHELERIVLTRRGL